MNKIEKLFKSKNISPYKSILLVSSLLSLLLGGICFLGLSVGPTGYEFLNVFKTLIYKEPQALHTIIWRIRFPRVLLAAVVGATLSVGGLVFQALLKNPLAEPYILGISGGAGVGAVAGMILGLAVFPGVAGLAFLGGMGSLFMVVFISSGRRLQSESSLLLAGVMINAFCSAIIMFLISIIRHTELQNVLFWLMGDLSGADPVKVLGLLAIVLPCFIFIFFMARPMNILLMGGETAQSLGVNVKAVTLSLLAVTSFIVSGSVCLSGLIGFVGLVVPHFLRMLLGADHRILVPACILGGSSFMVACDLLARSITSQGEMPVGVVTALIGAPAFITLLYRSRG